MDGYDYEYLVAKYLRNHGYTGVRVTKASGDYGVDVIAHKRGHKYAVQCKYYSSPVGISAVQEAAAGKAFYGCDSAMVVTNNTFTKAAHDLAKANGVVLLGGVTSSGTSKARLIAFRILLAGIYLFFATAIMGAVLDAVKGQSTLQMIGNITSVVLILLIPPGLYVTWKIVRQKRKGRKRHDSRH